MEMESDEQKVEIGISVVMSCLNGRAIIDTCIERTQRAMKELGVQGKVMVVDNGSTDASVAMAEKLGAFTPLTSYPCVQVFLAETNG